MAYEFDFQGLGEYVGVLAHGLWLTTQLTVVAAACGIAVAILGAWARTGPLGWLRSLVGGYVELVRNTPFLVQLFVIFFGLPSAGVRLSEVQAAVVAMVINLGAYGIEIVRAGLEAVPRGHVDAGLSLGMTRAQVFRRVMLRPALQNMWPALSSQIVIVMLGSAACSQIAAEELTFAAGFIQSRTFRPFETYLAVTCLYLLLAILLRQLLRMVGLRLLGRRVG